jgi:hypothetical protein
VRARVYAMVLAGGYPAAVPVAVSSHGWAVAKAAGDVARAVVSVQHLRVAGVVDDVVPAAA